MSARLPEIVSPQWKVVPLTVLLDSVVTYGLAAAPSRKEPKWTAEEDRFVIEHLGWITDAEMGAELGRTETAVHLRWDRDLGLPGPSKAPDVITAHQAARALGIDGHKIAHWVDAGIIPGRIMAGGRNIRLIQRVTFLRWACSHDHWMYFDRKRARDPHIKRLLQLEAKRWGDEWWSTRQAADYKGVVAKDIMHQIKMGRLPGSMHMPVSLGGRDHNRRWSNWFVLRSEVKALVIPRGQGRNGVARNWTPAADRWILKARDQLGMEFQAIARTVGNGQTDKTIMYRYHKIKQGRKS